MARDAIAARLAAFVDAGHDPLTVPDDWHCQEPIAGTSAPDVLPGHGGGLDLVSESEACRWADAQGSTSLLVSRNGELVLEHYGVGTERGMLEHGQSMAKTVAALLVGIAIDRREIADVDVPVGQWIEEWRDDSRATITLRQLLTMSSGLGQVDAGHGLALTLDNPAVRQFFGDDQLGPVLELPLVEQPDTRFDYNNANVVAIAAVLERATGRRYVDLLVERLWLPLGLGPASLAIDRPGGMPRASMGIFARPVDWLRIGELIAGLHPGIVSADWLSAMATPSITEPRYGFLVSLGDQVVGGPPLLPVLHPWQSEPFAAEHMLMLNGFGGQRAWVMPTRRLVVVRTGRQWPTEWDDAVLPNLIWHGTSAGA